MTNFKSDISNQMKSNFKSDVRVRISEYELFVFWKIWRALFSCNTRFEIHPFGFLPKFDVWQGSDRFLHWLKIRFPATLHQHNIKKLWPLRHIINKAFSTYAYVKHNVSWCLMNRVIVPRKVEFHQLKKETLSFNSQN